MAKYIPDIRSLRWVILAPGRFGKPNFNHKKYELKTHNGLKIADDCPFCPGNENLTPLEVDSISKDHSWAVRAFGNKYPITDIHEIIVHHPDHLKDIEEFDQTELLNLMQMYQRRLKALSVQGVPILFRNKGVSSGTSIPHPHSQIIVLPEQINLQSLALEPVKNVVLDNNYFVLYCPDFSQYPYEVWITHKECAKHEVGDPAVDKITLESFSEAELLDLGQLLQKVLNALRKTLDNFDYNYYISPKPPFYLRLVPRLLIRGGFEIGTGLSTNTLDPQDAAENLKKMIK